MPDKHQKEHRGTADSTTASIEDFMKKIDEYHKKLYEGENSDNESEKNKLLYG